MRYTKYIIKLNYSTDESTNKLNCFLSELIDHIIRGEKLTFMSLESDDFIITAKPKFFNKIVVELKKAEKD